MSRANIVSMDIRDYSVTFQLRNGGQRTYYYSMPDFAAILNGDDPANYTGNGGIDDIASAAEALLE